MNIHTVITYNAFQAHILYEFVLLYFMLLVHYGKTQEIKRKKREKSSINTNNYWPNSYSLWMSFEIF